MKNFSKKILSQHSQKKQSGFSLVEVMVASLIFALSIAGIMATVSALNRPATQTSREVIAAMLGEQLLEKFRKEVNASNWDGLNQQWVNGSPLTPGTHPSQTIPGPDGKNYTVTWTVNMVQNQAGTGDQMAQVSLTVNWNN